MEFRKMVTMTLYQFNSVQSLSHVWLFATPWTAACQASLSITKLLEFTQTHVHWVGDAIQPSHPLRPLLLLTSIFPNIRIFSNESVVHIRWPKYYRFRFSISSSNEYSGLVSFRMRLWLCARLPRIASSMETVNSWITSRCSSSVLWVSSRSLSLLVRVRW